MRLSVCMATYNGAAYLPEQLESILAQLAAGDELVVVDDGSRDDTLQVLRACGDARLQIHCNERNMRHVRTFERAMQLASGDVIFLADQDDVWVPGRVSRMLRALQDSGAAVVAGNFSHIDAQGRPIDFPAHRLRAADSRRPVANVAGIFAGRRGYFGCAMAVRREFLALALPIPDFVESHDMWIAQLANTARAIVHLDEDTLARRIHGHNVTRPNRPLQQKLRSRWRFWLAQFEARRRVQQARGRRG